MHSTSLLSSVRPPGGCIWHEAPLSEQFPPPRPQDLPRPRLREPVGRLREPLKQVGVRREPVDPLGEGLLVHVEYLHRPRLRPPPGRYPRWKQAFRRQEEPLRLAVGHE